jgi:hypothetical protein
VGIDITANYSGRQYSTQSNYSPVRLSVSIWVNPSTTTGYITAAGKGFSTTTRGSWSIGKGATSHFGFYIQFSPDFDPYAYGNWVETTSHFTKDTWNHLLGVYDGANMLLYWNGALTVGEVQHQDIPALQVPIKAGGKMNDSIVWHAGLAEFALWNTPLNQDEATALAGGIPATSIRSSSLFLYDPLFVSSNNVFVNNKTDKNVAEYSHPHVVGRGA